MILGIGSDLVDTKRIDFLLKRFNQRFKNRIFTLSEQNYCESQHYVASSYAKRFAAKEACVKALGIGFQAGIRWIDIEILNNSNGKPFLTLQGKAFLHLKNLLKDLPEGKEPRLDLSLCDEGFHAHAFVVISYQ
jgi:holo-[acyl-carrier protein] synthase